MTFSSLSLHPKLLEALAESGYTVPTEIQQRAIPLILADHDLRASAQTGTGKTAAFLLPILHRLAQHSGQRQKGPRALILAPTRELAMQIETQAQKYSRFLKHISSVCIGGGVPYGIQMRKLSRPYQLLIATPGRLLDYMERGTIDLSNVEVLVLDEADRMLDMGFLEPVEQIVQETPAERQTLLFSATLKGAVAKLSQRLLSSPEEVSITPTEAQLGQIEQRLYRTNDLHHKNRLLSHLLQSETLSTAIIFTSTKRHADQLVAELEEDGFSAGALHGDMSQGQRNRTLMRLRNGQIQILVATDVAARGIDVQNLSHVFNFDLPRNPEDYIHRIGRTGRAGASGFAFSFVSPKDRPLLKRIESLVGGPITIAQVEGLEPASSEFSKAPSAKPMRRRASAPRESLSSGTEKEHRPFPKRERGSSFSDGEFPRKRRPFSSFSEEKTSRSFPRPFAKKPRMDGKEQQEGQGTRSQKGKPPFFSPFAKSNGWKKKKGKSPILFRSPQTASSQ